MKEFKPFNRFARFNHYAPFYPHLFPPPRRGGG
jgi:hypothetical protein